MRTRLTAAAYAMMSLRSETQSRGNRYTLDQAPAPASVSPLPLHDALPIFMAESRQLRTIERLIEPLRDMFSAIFFVAIDRKSTRLNSSHITISYAVFCLKKKTPSSATMAARL